MTRREARELVARAERDGGFTYDVSERTFPNIGFAVGAYPEKERKVRTLTAGAIRRYARANAGILREPGAHLGAWRDGGTWYLDVSLVAPDVTLARVLAQVTAQLAIYDLATRQALASY